MAESDRTDAAKHEFLEDIVAGRVAGSRYKHPFFFSDALTEVFIEGRCLSFPRRAVQKKNVLCEHRLADRFLLRGIETRVQPDNFLFRVRVKRSILFS